MSSIKKAILFSIVLIILATVSISVRTIFSDPNSVPAGDSLWELSWEFSFEDSIVNEEVRIATPIDTQHAQVIEQKIALQGMRIDHSRSNRNGTREIATRITNQQDHSIKIDFTLHVSPIGIPHYIKKTGKLNAEQRQLYTSAKETLPINDDEVLELLSDINNNIEEPGLVFNSLFKYCTAKIITDDEQGMDAVIDIIDTNHASVLGKVRLLTTLARASKIPARIVVGLILDEESEVKLHYWMEINVDDEWLAYDPSEGYVVEVPINYLPIRKNGESIVAPSKTVQLKQMDLEISKRDPTIDFFNQDDKSLHQILDLNRLSLSTRLTLAFLLLLPLGALITVFIRQIIGPNVYGTFTPTFLALALTQVGWITGGIILCIVTVIGVIGRSFTPILGLNRVSRLTMVFILVAISMIFSVSLLMYFGLAIDGSIVLLPIIILTFMIDQIYTLADSSGARIALLRLAWTFVVSAIVAYILQMDLLGLWLLSYPEAHLITAALVIIISLYKGKKWLRIIGLNWMLEPKKTDSKSSKKEDKDNKPLEQGPTS